MALPPRLAQWEHLFQASGERHGINPCLLAAICRRESFGGLYLKPQGAEGSGDFTPRSDNSRRPVYALDGRFSAIKTPDGHVCYVPADGHGWGRGLLQVDYAAHLDWCSLKAPSGLYLWQVPEANVEKGAEIFESYRNVFAHGLLPAMLHDKAEMPDVVLACAIAAYNAGPTRVMRKVLELTTETSLDAVLYAVDRVTTESNYASAVLGFLKLFSQPVEVTT